MYTVRLAVIKFFAVFVVGITSGKYFHTATTYWILFKEKWLIFAYRCIYMYTYIALCFDLYTCTYVCAMYMYWMGNCNCIEKAIHTLQSVLLKKSYPHYITTRIYMYMCLSYTYIYIYTMYTYLSILPQYPDEGSLALWVTDRVQRGGQLGKDHLYHVIKLTQYIYRGGIWRYLTQELYDTGSVSGLILLAWGRKIFSFSPCAIIKTCAYTVQS